MSKRNKITARVFLLVLTAPAFMIFNENFDTIYINVIGIAYILLMAKLHRRILPRWLVDYIHED